MNKLLNDFFTYDDSQLIKNCIKGERQSQKKLYDLYSKQMFKICSSYVVNKKKAELLLHDGFVLLFQNIRDFKFDRPFEDWARSFFVNTAMEFKSKDQA